MIHEKIKGISNEIDSHSYVNLANSPEILHICFDEIAFMVRLKFINNTILHSFLKQNGNRFFVNIDLKRFIITGKNIQKVF